MVTLLSFLIMLVPAVLLGLIPANIAKKKGRDFGLWWLYGTVLFIVALIHSLLMEDQSNVTNSGTNNGAVKSTTDLTSSTSSISVAKDSNSEKTTSLDNFEQVTKYKELLDNGIITQEEYDAKRKELLKL